ncbi:MAG: hypothetical protein QOE86_2824 [Solirubrobacteraceae bacterium]|jgi:uncharacterized protein (TIGR00369 family)|nr:hypothetical protein [Solirubrobacteraceae bacterium]
MSLRSKEVTWNDPADTALQMATLPGREVFERVRDGRLPAPPMARLFGFEILEVGDGEVRFACTPDESTANPMGMVHGGTLCTLLDTVAGCALHTTLPAGSAFSTIEIKVSFLRALTPGTRLQAHGKVIRRGRNVAFAEGSAIDDQGRLVGTATTSLMIAPPA